METPIIPLRARHDGWTPARQRAFLAALADTGGVAAAARRVGMSKAAAYKLRRHPLAAAFRDAWDAALQTAWAQVEASALERAINGEVMVIEQGDMRFTRHRPCAPQLLIRLLDRAIRVRESAAGGADGA
jgi:hypothetical protein